MSWTLLTTRGVLRVDSCAACAALVPTVDREVHSFTHAHSAPTEVITQAEQPARRGRTYVTRSATVLLWALVLGAAVAAVVAVIVTR